MLAGDDADGRAGRHGVRRAAADADRAARPRCSSLTQQVETRPLGRRAVLPRDRAFALVVAAVVAALLARRLTRPIAAMQEHGRTDRRRRPLRAGRRVDALPDDELGGLARSINAMADELETAQGHERAFLLSISHDLRTPLTSIKGYAEAMADGHRAPPDRTRAAARHRDRGAAARAARRRPARPRSSRRARVLASTPRPIDARGGRRRDASTGSRPRHASWGVRARPCAPGDPVDVEADPERLAQIVANLVENALKYATSEVRRRSSRRRNGHVELHVDDDGPGIAPDERERVFERLYTARGAPSRKVGTGIGLAIVHELAAAMGGTATCEPLDGAAARASSVRLPARGKLLRPVALTSPPGQRTTTVAGRLDLAAHHGERDTMRFTRARPRRW